MTRMIAKIGCPRPSQWLGAALILDQAAFFLFELFARTTNPIVITAIIATDLVHWFHRGDRQFTLPPHID